MIHVTLGWTIVMAMAGQFDMAAIAKWNNARVVHYQITGTFKGDAPLSSKYAYGFVEVTDTIGLELDWDLRASAPVGAVKFTNAATQVGRTSARPADCPAPKVGPGYEYMNVTAAAPDSGGRVVLTGTRSYPAGAVPADWPATCAPKPVDASQEAQTTFVAIIAPQMLVMPNGANPNMSVSADKKSFTIKTNDWAWTYTPTLVK